MYLGVKYMLACTYAHSYGFLYEYALVFDCFAKTNAG